MDVEFNVWPLTIMPTRYMGAYEGGRWAAFNLYPDQVPAEAHGSDLVCSSWWDFVGKKLAGLGTTAEEAIKDLESKVEFNKAYWRA